MRRVVRWSAVIGIALLVLLCVAPLLVDRALNRVIDVPLPLLSESGRGLHSTLNVVDLHADPLLWNRDLLARAGHGHVDIPRLIEGNVAVQVFSAPTQVPSGLNYDANELHWDLVTSLAVFQGWPMRTWQSPFERARFMADQLRDAASRSGGKFHLIERKQQLADYLAQHRAAPGTMTAGMLSIEGLHALEGKLENVEALQRSGFRMMGLTHFFDNQVGGSAHGMQKGGLTDFGRQVVRTMEDLGIIVDLAHASPRVIDEVLAFTRRPVVVSHGGVKGTCDTIRNLSDAHLRAIAANGGVVGIGYWDAAVCDVSVAGVAKAIRYAIDVAGADHVGLGSDFDGATQVPFDTSQLALISDALLQSGVAESDIRKVMGDNALRLLRDALPE